MASTSPTDSRLEQQLGRELQARTGLPLPWFEVLLRLARSGDGQLSLTPCWTGCVPPKVQPMWGGAALGDLGMLRDEASALGGVPRADLHGVRGVS